MARITPDTEKNLFQESRKHLHQQNNKYKSWERYTQSEKITETWCPYLILLLSKSYLFKNKFSQKI